MKKILRAILLTLCFCLCSCATLSGLWSYKSGGEGYQVAKPNDAARIIAPWGEIIIYPKVFDAYGLNLEVSIKNNSDKDVSFEQEFIAVQNESGEVVMPAKKETIDAIAQRIGAVATRLAFGSGTAQTGAQTGNALEAVYKKMIGNGPVLKHSTKKGIIFYDHLKTTGPITIRVSEKLTGTEQQILFDGKHPTGG